MSNDNIPFVDIRYQNYLIKDDAVKLILWVLLNDSTLNDAVYRKSGLNHITLIQLLLLVGSEQKVVFRHIFL